MAKFDRGPVESLDLRGGLVCMGLPGEKECMESLVQEKLYLSGT